MCQEAKERIEMDFFVCSIHKHSAISKKKKKANTDVTQVLILRGRASTGQGIKSELPVHCFASDSLLCITEQLE